MTTPPVSWHTVDGGGLALTTGRRPGSPGAPSPGAPSPAAAIAAIPVAAWPLAVVGDDGRSVDVATALGTGGARVAGLVDRLARRTPRPSDLDLAALARDTPGGTIDRPAEIVGMAEAAEAAGAVDPEWLTIVARRRESPRDRLEAAGRGTELDAALHLAMLVATAPLDEGCRPEERVASGARLWLLGGAVAWALLGDDAADPFSSWADLVSYGLWPVGPVGGRLVVGVVGVEAAGQAARPGGSGPGRSPLTVARI